MIPSFGERRVMVEILWVGQYNIHFRFHKVLQLSMDPRALVPYSSHNCYNREVSLSMELGT